MRSPLSAKLYPLLLTLAVAPAVAAQPQTFSAKAAARPSAVLPRVTVQVSGPLEARARQTLLGRAPALAQASLVRSETHSLPGGRTLVRFRQEHDGVLVLSRGASVLLDDRNEPTAFATARVASRFAGASKPSRSAASVAGLASSAARGAWFSSADARLAWLPREPEARLVWVFYQGLVPGTPRSPVVIVDAHTGKVLQRFDATRFDRAATVFEQNPISTPTAKGVTLDALTTGATELKTERVHSLTCVDKKSLVGKWQIHACVFEPKALADAQGDFPYPYVNDVDPEDAFAEVSMFYHTTKAYSFYESLGMPELLLKPLTTVANLRFPQGWDTQNESLLTNPSLPLEPYDNAFFTPQNPFPGLFSNIQGGLFFGQGTLADFAYDGDVVYHELAHAMVDRTVNLESMWHLDPQGSLPSPGSMNEALADYFSSALTGDSKVGEYASKNLYYGFGDQSIRDLNNSDSCPKDMAGEVHVDSTMFSGALWSVRGALPEADRKTFDTAIMTALIGATSGNLGYEDLVELFSVALEASSLGAPVATALEAEFTKRGILPSCKRVIEYKGQPLNGPAWKLGSGFMSAGRPYVGFDETYPYAPGLFQTHRQIPAGTQKVRVAWEEVPLGPQYSLGQGAEPFTAAVLLRFGAGPIEFDYSAGFASNAGDPYEPSTSAVTVDVPEGAKEVWAMIVNLGDEMGLYRNFEVTVKSAPLPTGGTGGGATFGGTGGTGGAPSTGGTSNAADEALEPGGGGCASSPGAPRGWTLLVLSALGLAFSARSARSRRARRAAKDLDCREP